MKFASLAIMMESGVNKSICIPRIIQRYTDPEVYCFPQCLKSLKLDWIEVQERFKCLAVDMSMLLKGSFPETAFDIPVLILGIVCVTDFNSNGLQT